ncbi:SGNH/GDSL hydrolase family protein [Rivularia sp. UHCC 0363]|uniref:SGNH/GDSL hydrolase family protein n=1 Tax=Rivularia sp. UHCC 0363 TaxID=3110244 RepID=UPI002B21BD32|nr:SGNH/GDSL hydrolase family protein [Rivularia sp. UHCC 0363]MEA5596603.1 SGNH/GDSL hydrolase family protein [Rivularia sp. UHCC 0363]
MSSSVKNFPAWAFFSLLSNGILLFAVILLIGKQQGFTAFFGAVVSSTPQPTNIQTQQVVAVPQGKRYKFNYKKWVNILKQEAEVAAEKKPRDLTILVGDSLSLWFPAELLPDNKTWLNQGISGEKTAGLLKRLNLFDRTTPETIFVMIGINDLIAGVNDETILQNQQQTMAYLRKKHPKAKIVVQSILPHQGEEATWEAKEKLVAIPNSRIRNLNQQLQTIAAKEDVKYLNLYPLFADKQGNLRSNFTTDGLHLNPNGYLVWSSALQLTMNSEQ